MEIKTINNKTGKFLIQQFSSIKQTAHIYFVSGTLTDIKMQRWLRFSSALTDVYQVPKGFGVYTCSRTDTDLSVFLTLLVGDVVKIFYTCADFMSVCSTTYWDRSVEVSNSISFRLWVINYYLYRSVSLSVWWKYEWIKWDDTLPYTLKCLLFF